MISQPDFLPMSSEETEELGIEQLDIILISGDAYVDHPSFGTAIIGRVLWEAGFSTGVISQPDWKVSSDLKRLGIPRLFFAVTSGNVDSMVNNYTPSLRRRESDVYSAKGAVRRPDRALLVYTDKIHSLFPEIPIVIGGIEASLRRFAHYDYWSDSVRRSVLADAPADILVYGMGERQIVEIARRIRGGSDPGDIKDIAGTAVKMSIREWRSHPRDDILEIPGFKEVSSDKRAYAKAFIQHYNEQDPITGRTVAQVHPKSVIIQNTPAKPLSTEELDCIYELAYKRAGHPSYRQPIPALETVRFSITSHRGCFGSCSFCALTHHQGRIIQSRSIDSVVREAEGIVKMKGFRGIIQDVGGPTANMYAMHCSRWDTGPCRDKLCSTKCTTLKSGCSQYTQMLRKLREVPGVRFVFIGSGIRHDLLLNDQSGCLEEICRHHISGHLKVAPEHVTSHVTQRMQKPPVQTLEAFMSRFYKVSRDAGVEQYILPYFMSGHPGCTVEDMIELAEYMRDHGLYTEQVQDFTPTPMTASTVMYYTGFDPFTMEEVHVPRGREKRLQRALLQYRSPRSRNLVIEALRGAGRMDLVGSSRRALVRGDSLKDKMAFHDDRKN